MMASRRARRQAPSPAGGSDAQGGDGPAEGRPGRRPRAAWRRRPARSPRSLAPWREGRRASSRRRRAARRAGGGPRGSPRPGTARPRARGPCAGGGRARAPAGSRRTRRSPTSAASPTRAAPSQGGPEKMGARGAGRETAVTRAARIAERARFKRGADSPVATLALLVVGDGLEQVLAPEVRPEHVGHPDLRVGDLPEQEVRDPHLAARADEQVGVGLARGVEVGREGLLGDAGGVLAVRHHVGQQPLHGVGDLGAARRS